MVVNLNLKNERHLLAFLSQDYDHIGRIVIPEYQVDLIEIIYYFSTYVFTIQ